jgi:hypothetical protein
MTGDPDSQRPGKREFNRTPFICVEQPLQKRRQVILITA